MVDENNFDQVYAEEQLRRSRHPIRKLIKYFYINNILKDVLGKAIDLGCGAGQLLEKLAPGSLGLELNPFLIEQLSSKGLFIVRYDINDDNGHFSGIPTNQYETLIISHVLEHFDDASAVMRKLFSSANDLGITRVIIVVPGKMGYKSDSTHRTFINEAYIRNHELEFMSGFQLISASHFPVPIECVGDLFIYQELKLIYDKT
jgi:SAM-dependent methyltransferase